MYVIKSLVCLTHNDLSQLGSANIIIVRARIRYAYSTNQGHNQHRAARYTCTLNRCINTANKNARLAIAYGTDREEEEEGTKWGRKSEP